MDLKYQSGFNNHFSTEALPGALPAHNNPLKAPYGLYSEQISGSAFTVSRHQNRKTWVFRQHPSVLQSEPVLLKAGATNTQAWSRTDLVDQLPPVAFRWQEMCELNESSSSMDFLSGLLTQAASQETSGVSVGQYAFNANNIKLFIKNSDADMVLVPYSGALHVVTELGELFIEPEEIAVIPRGLRFQVNSSKDGVECRGYFCENFGSHFELPELGPLGANGLASPKDFLYPVAKFFEDEGDYQLVHKFQDQLWSTQLKQHPCDVVAWHGNFAPYKYDLKKFNTMGSISFDHPDPSIFTVLTSPSLTPGQANIDFVIFPPRWLVAESTFRPPYYHQNVMSEYMGLIKGEYDAKQGGFVPGASSLHNRFVPHGPDSATFDKEHERNDEPQKLSNTMAFMFESQSVYWPTKSAMTSAKRDKDYHQCWQLLKKQFL